jgi:hypothetical protein
MLEFAVRTCREEGSQRVGNRPSRSADADPLNYAVHLPDPERILGLF